MIIHRYTLQPKRKTAKDGGEKVSKTGKTTGRQEQSREQLEDQSQTQQEQTLPSKHEETETPLITSDIVVRFFFWKKNIFSFLFGFKTIFSYKCNLLMLNNTILLKINNNKIIIRSPIVICSKWEVSMKSTTRITTKR